MILYVCMCVHVCVCLPEGRVGGGRIKKMKKLEWIRTKQKKKVRGILRECSEAQKAYHTCELQAQTRPCTKPEGSTALAVPSLLSAFLLLTHLCSAGRHIMSPRNPLRRMSLTEQATITQTCQALPVGIESNTSD